MAPLFALVIKPATPSAGVAVAATRHDTHRDVAALRTVAWNDLVEVSATVAGGETLVAVHCPLPGGRLTVALAAEVGSQLGALVVKELHLQG